jgi:hypothetical protein
MLRILLAAIPSVIVDGGVGKGGRDLAGRAPTPRHAHPVQSNRPSGGKRMVWS